jgi:hypothetical protein
MRLPAAEAVATAAAIPLRAVEVGSAGGSPGPAAVAEAPERSCLPVEVVVAGRVPMIRRMAVAEEEEAVA